MHNELESNFLTPLATIFYFIILLSSWESPMVKNDVVFMELQVTTKYQKLVNNCCYSLVEREGFSVKQQLC